MNSIVKKQLIAAIFKFKKVNTHLLSGNGITLNEVVAMIMIEDNCLNDKNIPLVTAIGETLCITQSAVSQLLGSLEKKGYVVRSIHQSDKRKYQFSLTPKGRILTQERKSEVDTAIEKMNCLFGEDKLLSLIETLNEFAEIAEQIQTNSNLGG